MLRPPQTFEKNSEFFPERFWKISQGWIPKPQFWYPPLRFGSQHRIPKRLFFLVFWVSTADFGFSAGRRNFQIFFLRCLSRKSGSQHQLRIKTLPSARVFEVNFPSARKFICSPPSHNNSSFSEPTFHGKSGHFEGKGKLLSRAKCPSGQSFLSDG